MRRYEAKFDECVLDVMKLFAAAGDITPRMLCIFDPNILYLSSRVLVDFKEMGKQFGCELFLLKDKERSGGYLVLENIP